MNIIPWRLKFLARILFKQKFWTRYFEELKPHGKLGALSIFIRSYFLYSNPNKAKPRSSRIQVAGLGVLSIYTFSDFFHFLEVFVERTYDMDDLSTPKTIFDVGANVGMFSLRARKLYPESKIWSFEPVSSNFQKLTENVVGHKDHITPCHFAVGAKNDAVDIHLHPVNSGAHSLFSQQVEDSFEKETIQIRDINELLEELDGQLDLLKLDCEGAEIDIVTGLRPELAQKIRRIIIETTYGLYTREEMLDGLERIGFSHRVSNGLLVSEPKAGEINTP